MSPHAKKLIGLVVLLPALLLYFGAIVTLAERLPSFWLAKLAFFLVSGLVWALPAIPFMRWMEREPGDKKKGAE